MTHTQKELEPLTGFGQINKGDRVLADYKGKLVSYLVREVLNKGTEHEEILINKKRNKYFIVSMALNGSSWAKNVRVLAAQTGE